MWGRRPKFSEEKRGIREVNDPTVLIVDEMGAHQSISLFKGKEHGGGVAKLCGIQGLPCKRERQHMVSLVGRMYVFSLRLHLTLHLNVGWLVFRGVPLLSPEGW